MQKRFGQNFMINPHMRQKIVKLLDPQPDDQVWEIGPGIGAISSLILERCRVTRLFEIDRGFIRILSRLFAAEIEAGKLEVIEGDALRTLFDRSTRPSRIAGNLPYNVGSGIISDLLVRGFADVPMVFTLQKEVVDRMAASRGDKHYGSFSVLCQYAMDVKNEGAISSGSFYPAPEVTSAIVSLEPRNPVAAGEFAVLDRLLRIFFMARRKTLRNNILKAQQSLPPPQKSGSSGQKPGEPLPQADRILAALEESGIAPSARAEELAPADYRRLTALLMRQPQAPG